MKIMVEVISILGIVTKELRQGRISMHFLVDISPESNVSRREICQDAVWSSSCCGRASTARQIYPRGSSHGSGGNPVARSPD
jgi:hypothetical protein